jgi:hypothetical protein
LKTALQVLIPKLPAGVMAVCEVWNETRRW